MTRTRALFAALSLSALALTSTTGCVFGAAFEAADCCTCLITHDPDGTEVAGADEAAMMSANCLPEASSPNEQGNICGNNLGRQLGGDPDATPLEIKSNACVESACADVCGLGERATFKLF